MSKEFIARKYQDQCLDFITDTRRGMLMADLGMGKTVSALTAYDRLLFTGYEWRPLLVIAPLRVARKVWSDEAAKWDHLSNIVVSPILGDDRARLKALNKEASVYTTNYENLPWLVDVFKNKAWPFGMMVADESTRLAGLRVSERISKTGKKFIQGQGTIRARKLAKMAWQSKNARWLNLSGTPSPNGLKKLFGQLWFCDFGERLGKTYTAFEQRFFKKGYDGYKIEPLPGADKNIHALIKDVCMSVLAKDWLDLEKPIPVPVYVDLPPKARKIYAEMKKNLYLKFGAREVEAVNAGSKANKLLQLASGAVYLDNECEDDDDPRAKDWVEIHDEKIQALETIIEEGGGMPLIVAYQFKSDAARLKKAFPKIRFLETEQDEDDFKAGKIQLLGCHPASAGHGIDGFQNVTNRIVFFSQWPDFELRDQIIGRIGPVRQFQSGFKRGVYIYDIIAADTRDEEVIDSHGEKKSIQDFLLDTMRR